MIRPPGWQNIGPWNKTNETREAFGIRTLDIAIDVHFDPNDREFHGDIRYDGLQRKHNRTLASEGGRWRDTVPLEPLKVEDLIMGQTYRFGELPLGSKLIMDERELTLNYYNYAPRPSKGAIVSTDLSEENNGFMTQKGVFTALGNKPVMFVSHPHKRIRPSKSAAAVRHRTPSPKKSTGPGSVSSRLKVPAWMQNQPSPKAVVRTPSRSSKYKKKMASRQRRVASARRRRRRKATSKARSVSTDKLSPKRSKTRKKSV